MRIFTDQNTRKTCRIYAMLTKHARGRHLSFHTPGHKKKGWDITELSYSDNLAAPRGCLAAAERDIAEILGAEKSFILTDGSTSGVLSMLYAAKLLGAKKIAFPVQSHKSIWNGCAAFGLTPLVFEEDFLEKASLADGIFLTSPTYYGKVADLEKIRAYCDEQGKTLLIDGAHGGHLHFERKLYAGEYADMWVDGVHKSLPAFTQGAVVSARSEHFACALQKAVDVFRTSSPSYPVMASVEYAVKYPRNEKLEENARKLMEHERVLFADDWTKICACFGKRAFDVENELEKKGIYPEFCDGNHIEFYLSPAMRMRDFKRLQKILFRLFEKYPYEAENLVERVHTPFVFSENAKKEWVPIEGSEGKICAENCGMFPPCTPLILAGERVTKEKISRLQKAANVYGIMDGKICIITEEKQ